MQEILYYNGNVSELAPNEVFAFGANPQGFHGAGAAGYASFNRSGNLWRQFGYADKPFGWKGKWNEKGKIGPMTGTHGKSYGLVTVARAGQKRSITPDELKANIRKFYDHASANGDFTFLVAQSHMTGLNGYSGQEMAELFAAHPIPHNVAFQDEFAKLVAKQAGANLKLLTR